MNSMRASDDLEWNYFRLMKPVADHVLMDEISPGVFECVALDGLPSKGPSNSDNPPNSFRTRDLFSRHPDPLKSHYWKYLARLDDRITLVNGEKVLPLPMEGTIRQDKLVREAVVFGIEKTVPGVMIFRGVEASTLTDEQYLEAVWPSVEAANANAESFSQIPRELVVIMPSDTIYPRTDKGTVIRASLYEVFASRIEQAYTAFEGAGSGTLQLDVAGLESYLLALFEDKIGVKLPSAESDIFSAGVDSLQATRIWNFIRNELDLGQNGGTLPSNTVFDKGNVRSLARHLYNMRTLGFDEEENGVVELMQNMITKYSSFETWQGASLPRAKGKVVVSLTLKDHWRHWC